MIIRKLWEVKNVHYRVGWHGRGGVGGGGGGGKCKKCSLSKIELKMNSENLVIIGL